MVNVQKLLQAGICDLCGLLEIANLNYTLISQMRMFLWEGFL